MEELREKIQKAEESRATELYLKFGGAIDGEGGREIAGFLNRNAMVQGLSIEGEEKLNPGMRVFPLFVLFPQERELMLRVLLSLGMP